MEEKKTKDLPYVKYISSATWNPSYVHPSNTWQKVDIYLFSLQKGFLKTTVLAAAVRDDSASKWDCND